MAQIDGRGRLEAQVVFVLTEAEAGALDALIGYGADEFLAVFYKHMGEAYLKPYEAGFRSLCGARGQLQHVIERAQDARRVFAGTHVAVERPKS